MIDGGARRLVICPRILDESAPVPVRSGAEIGTSLADYQDMNATIPNFQANPQAPAAPAINAAPSSEPTPAGAAPTDSAGAAAGRSDFAGTLNHVIGRGSRKSDPAKAAAAGTGGASLPVTGTVPPIGTVPPTGTLPA